MGSSRPAYDFEPRPHRKALPQSLDFCGQAFAEYRDISRIVGVLIFLSWFVHLPPVFPSDLFLQQNYATEKPNYIKGMRLLQIS